MSDYNELKTIGEFVSSLFSGLSKEVTRTSDKPAHGGLFPDGVNDILLDVKVGNVSLGLEVSGANQIHNGQPKTPFRHAELESSQIPIRPMFAVNSNDFSVYVGVSDEPFPQPNRGTEVQPGSERTVDAVYVSNVEANTSSAWVKVSRSHVSGWFEINAGGTASIPWK